MLVKEEAIAIAVMQFLQDEGYNLCNYTGYIFCVTDHYLYPSKDGSSKILASTNDFIHSLTLSSQCHIDLYHWVEIDFSKNEVRCVGHTEHLKDKLDTLIKSMCC